MRSTFLPFSRPSISEEDIEAVAEVLRSGWITSGPNVNRFEEDFCRSVGAEGAVALTSATAGMHLVLAALGIGPGDEVITPSMTWVSTVNLITLLGATPVFVDIDRDTLMPSPEAIESAITERTRLVVPVHFAGAAADIDPIREICTARGVRVIEDAAHALGTETLDRPIGARGTAIFSFHPIKNITTGEGGMVTSDDAELLDHIRRLRFHGLGVDAFDRQRQGRAPQAEVIEPGFKYNLTDIQATLGVRQLARVADFNARRTALAAHYHERLEEFETVRPLSVPPSTGKHAWHLFVVRWDNETGGMDRNTFMKRLEEQKIGTGIHFRAVHSQYYYREHLQIPPGTLPETEWNSERICSLPLFPQMTLGDVDDVIDAIRTVDLEARR